MCGLACFTTELDRSGFFLQGKGKGRGSGAYKTKKTTTTNKQTDKYRHKKSSRLNNSMKLKRRISGKQGANKTRSKIQY